MTYQYHTVLPPFTRHGPGWPLSYSMPLFIVDGDEVERVVNTTTDYCRVRTRIRQGSIFFGGSSHSYSRSIS